MSLREDSSDNAYRVMGIALFAYIQKKKCQKNIGFDSEWRTMTFDCYTKETYRSNSEK